MTKIRKKKLSKKPKEKKRDARADNAKIQRIEGKTAYESLPLRRQKMIDEYFNCGFVYYEAYKRAGFKSRGANGHNTASRIFNEPLMKEAIEEKRRYFQANVDVNTERILKEIDRVALFNIKNIFNSDGTIKKVWELDDETSAAISTLEGIRILDDGTLVISKMKFWDKGKMLQLAAQARGMLDKKEKDETPLEQQMQEMHERAKAMRECTIGGYGDKEEEEQKEAV